MPTENESNNSLIPSGSNGLIRVQHSIEITNKILKERNDRLVQSDYESVKIGNQIWMAKNLNVDRFRNGDLIPEIKSDEDWKRAGEERKPAWCYYDNDVQNGMIYGKLYNWFAVNDPRGLAPEGWHIPSNEEWDQLSNFLGGEEIAGKKMKHIDLWNEKSNGTNEQGNGTNEVGFKGVPGGYRHSYDGRFKNIGFNGWWITATQDGEDEVWHRNLNYKSNSLSKSSNFKKNGYSIRCLKS